ncbi:DUF554 domain-containing protein [Lysinibacillus halotolerans]|uniref:DUF554 domain-containing protein n=1 Tax=Lysinibacillus halotolerans TaxID=1368476 RepID=A0A3M8H9V1_9BACI|nr:DUF554 domain-containing protein [Lysinibacillus halotolerans]RNC98870.1 DUF554 domain-containing protein [Lysinibacillus halotolerans]
MVLLGTFINVLLIVVGSIIGRFFKNISDNMKSTVLMGIGLAVTLLGIQMGFKTSNFIIVIISLVIGAVIGEWIDLDKKLFHLGKWKENKIGNKSSEKGIAEGFVNATLIFIIGSMGILGALDSGIRNDHSVLITKGIIDGFTAIVLSSTLGIGVLISAIPVLFYEGIITLFAKFISEYIPEAALNLFIQEMTATGGVMIMAIGLNIAGLTKVRVANLLPGIVIVGLVVTVMFLFQ